MILTDSDVEETNHDDMLDVDNNAYVEDDDDDEYVTESDKEDDDDVHMALPTEHLVGTRFRTGASGGLDVSTVLNLTIIVDMLACGLASPFTIC